jgi:hypothetical protein
MAAVLGGNILAAANTVRRHGPARGAAIARTADTATGRAAIAGGGRARW